MKRLYWIVTGLMAAFMLMASVPDILLVPQAVEFSRIWDIRPICFPSSGSPKPSAS